MQAVSLEEKLMDEQIEKNGILTKQIIEVVIKIAILGMLVVWTFQLIKPFLIPVIWGLILAVTVEPFIAKLAKILGGRKSLASGLFVLVIFAALIIPSAMLAVSSVETIQELTGDMESRSLVIPPPPETVADWPIIGETVHKTWELASTNLEGALKQFAPQIKSVAGTLLGSVGGGLVGIFMIIISTIIAGVFLAKAEKSSAIVERIITRVAGKKGMELKSLITATIRGVMQGVVGVAVIQSVLAAIGMVLVGVPAAGLWAVLILVLAVSQLPPILVLGPVAAYVFSITGTTTAVIFLLWALFVTASDSFLKPMLMGRGVDIPMLVILLGALGGMMFSGIIGLFTGAVVLALMYTLFMAWIAEDGTGKAILDENNSLE